ncbi:alcohol dehydrogenase superfamily protein [Cylindrobasidium torrendii FP15055 ss-10]|uniref:Alcohol dehydrogenase superfamily protein n=1 Tax=Cylindrobasidium torrendii FP15055 ss-10 TaxID=1314674 RepID=A0A0D7BC83_9AGAR|nr:alcohol dehydrogenase superfamily protein [Cylindrobasidium torrendii FP15055 ss-10]
MANLPTSTRNFVYAEQKKGWDKLKQTTAPLQPLKPYEVLVKIHAVSLQFRDIMIADGSYPAPLPENLVPCSDMAGEVIAVGAEAEGTWKVGDRVCSNFSTTHLDGDPTPDAWAGAQGGNSQGVLTEYKAYKPEALIQIPEHLSYEEASTLPCAALTAYNALLGARNPLRAGETVLVQGTGGVSIFGLQFAVASGAKVIVTSSSDKKLELAKKLGATYTINYNTTPEWGAEALKLTGGQGVDHILEVTGTGLLESIKALKTSGSIGVIGARGIDIPSLQALPMSIVFKGANIRGVIIGSVAQFKAMNRLIAANPDATRPVVDKVFKFEQTVEAYDYLSSQKHVGKVVISFDQ